MYLTLLISTAVLLLVLPESAQAYLGPVLGLGLIGTVITLIAVGLLSVFSFVYLPVRKFIRRNRRADDEDHDQPES